MPTETPAEKSAKMVHILKSSKKTVCGITFKRSKFYNNNTVSLVDHKRSTCDRCLGIPKPKRERKSS